MKNYILKYTLGILLILGMGMVSCDDRDDELKELNLDRTLTPYKLVAEITNTVELSLKWDAPKGADGYIVELYIYDLESQEESFYLMDEVLEKTYSNLNLLSNTQYLARVKAVSVDNNDSNWASIAFKTAFKSIMLESKAGDITKTSIKYRWTPGAEITELVFFVPGGNEIARRALTAQELASGTVEFANLDSNIRHTLRLYGGTDILGETTLTTLPDGSIPVSPSNDLKEKLEAAEEGDIFMLEAGTYLPEGIVVTITKNITVMGAVGEEPVIHGQFLLTDPAGITFKNVVLDGTKSDATLLDYVVKLPDVESGNFGNIIMEGCVVRNYNKALVAGDKMKAKIASIKILNSIVTNIKTDGSDLIDFRIGYVAEVEVKNSTFNKVAASRSFLRLDDASASFPESTTVINISDCTFYGVSETASGGFLYVRFTSNISTIKNNIFAETLAFYTKQSKTTMPDFGNNNYFNTPNLIAGGTITGTKVDGVSPSTTDPQFENPANGNFKTVLSGKGDPRWYQ